MNYNIIADSLSIKKTTINAALNSGKRALAQPGAGRGGCSVTRGGRVQRPPPTAADVFTPPLLSPSPPPQKLFNKKNIHMHTQYIVIQTQNLSRKKLLFV